MQQPSQKQKQHEQGLALVWLLGGAPLTLFLSGFIHFLGIKPWLCALLFLVCHAALLRLYLGGFVLNKPRPLKEFLAFWTADLLWLAVLMSPWWLAASVCLLVSFGLVCVVAWRLKPSGP